jgi:Ca2+/Na+ antiporter
MIAFVRLAVFGFLFLGVIYLLVSVYSRSVRRERLEKEWDEEINKGDRDAYIKDGMVQYEGSLRKQLIVLVFIVPVVVVTAMLYIINFM